MSLSRNHSFVFFCCLFWLLCSPVHAEDAVSADGPPPLIEKLRQGTPLDKEERAYVDRLRKKRRWSTEEVADFIEKNWTLSEAETRLRDADAPSGLRHRWPFSEFVAPEQQYSFLLPLFLGLGVAVVLVGWFLIRKNWREYCRETRLRQGHRVSELIIVPPKNGTPVEELPPEDPNISH